jgi:hypothetical protein
MRFGRRPIEAAPLPIATPPPAAPASTIDDASVPFVDHQGAGFDLLRSMDLGFSLWRTSAPADLERLDSRQIVVVAAYSPEDIESSRPLMKRFMTIVLAMGLGPHYGSRALTLGAVGYVDGSRDDGEIRGVFGDAVARVRIRRLREAAA